jgi:phosphotransferase system  glucose/maltose/N-acetylglucosamine-specific IIC component
MAGVLMTYWSAWTVGLLLILVFPAIAVLAQIGIRRAWPRLAEGEHNDVAGFIIAVVGVIYAVLLAFVVIVSWEKFNSAESVVGEEAARATEHLPGKRGLSARGARSAER